MIKKIMLVLLLVLMVSHCSSPPPKAPDNKPASDSDIRSSVVRLTGAKGTCSGEQVQGVSGTNYILSAGHCKGISNEAGTILVTTEDGRMLYRRVIMEDPHSDLLLLEGVPNLPALSLSDSLSKHQHIRTFTHGANLDTYMTEGVVIQNQLTTIPVSEAKDCPELPKYKILTYNTFFGPFDVCVLSIVETVTTARIVPGSSGGAIVNDRGELVGVASASGDYFSYLVTLKDIHRLLDNY